MLSCWPIRKYVLRGGGCTTRTRTQCLGNDSGSRQQPAEKKGPQCVCPESSNEMDETGAHYTE